MNGAPLRRCLFALALCSSALACTPKKTMFRDSDRTAIASLFSKQKAAWNRGDIADFMEGYARSEDLVFTSGGSIRRGWRETHDRYLARYGTDSSTMGSLDFALIDITPVGADGAVVLGRWSLEGLPEPAGGVFSVVLERRREGWRIVHDHTSSDP